jgi:opacity protein-like surface antigen
MQNLRFASLVLTALCVATAAAQESSHFEVFGGYSMERIAPCGALGSADHPCGVEAGFLPLTTTFNGWDAAFTGYFSKFVGATADFSVHYGPNVPNNPNVGVQPSISRRSYMFGPAVAWRKSKLAPFAHVLLGRTSQTIGRSYAAFSWAVGGGLDASVSKRLAIRLADLDYESVQVPGNAAANGLRYSGGVVFRF